MAAKNSFLELAAGSDWRVVCMAAPTSGCAVAGGVSLGRIVQNVRPRARGRRVATCSFGRGLLVSAVSFGFATGGSAAAAAAAAGAKAGF